MTNPHIETLVNFLRDFADANADSFTPEQIEYLKQSSHAIVILDTAVDELVKERDDAFKQIDELQDVCGDSADRMVELRKERDDARREICFLTVFDPEVPHADCSIYEREVATKRGWDCFKEDSDAEESH